MKRFLTRASVAGLSAALVAGVALVAAPAASAAQIGDLTFSTLTNQDTTFSVTTTGACPATSTNIGVLISGGNVPAGDQFIAGNIGAASVGGITGGAFTVPIPQTLAGFASSLALPGGYLGNGTYTMTMRCRAGFNPASLGEFVNTFTVTGTGANGVAVTVPAAPTTTTAPTVSGSPVFGTNNVTVSTTVKRTSDNANATGGTVEFRNGAVVLGSGAVAAGVASATFTLPVGSTPVAAYYLGGSGFSASNSAATNVVVGKGAPTNGTLAVSPAVVTTSTPVTATLSGLPTSFAGVCSFIIDGGAAQSGTAAAGSAAFTFGTVGAGAHTVTAECAADANWNATTLQTVSFNAQSRIRTDWVTQEINVTAPAGTLTITIKPLTDNFVENEDIATLPGNLPRTLTDSKVQLTDLALVSGTNYLLSTGSIKNFLVTDRRSGELGYVVTAKLDDLAGPGSNKIVAQNVGIVTTLVDFNRPGGVGNLQLQATGSVAPADGALANAADAFGLDDERDLYKAPVGTSIGTSEAAADLTIHAPTSVPAGAYKGNLTLSVYSV